MMEILVNAKEVLRKRQQFLSKEKKVNAERERTIERLKHKWPL